MRNVIIRFFLFSLLTQIWSIELSAQTSTPGVPFGIDKGWLDSYGEIKFERMVDFDLEVLRIEDELLDGKPGVPWRFGHNFFVNYSLTNSGEWNLLDNGDKVWRLGIESKGALSLNLAFKDFLIPSGSKLFIYTPCGRNVLGAFSNLNNQPDGYFATVPILGDAVIIEYFEPATVDFEGSLNLFRVTHGYRGIGEITEKGFGQSGSCNINVACPQAAGWNNQIRSVAKILRNGNDWCTGALINNTNNDGKPYLLSANHCFASEGSLVFIFNWQSETCSNPLVSPPIVHSVSGAVTRARSSQSDVWLLELNNPLPEEFNVFFSGWNRDLSDEIPGRIVGIHHPRGDIKKFSYSDSGVKKAGYLGAPNSGDSHWRIIWDGGTTTEPASSGSPIFDSNGRIIGQLHGGNAACGNSLPDWYGRFGVSMNNGLNQWLDPRNSGVAAIGGYDPILDAIAPGAPGPVTDIDLEVADDGRLLAKLSWKNPSKTFSGNVLSQLDSINIYRNGELIISKKPVEIGMPSSFTDNDLIESGTVKYTIRGVNSSGIGASSGVSGYVGFDRPGPVRNLKLEAAGKDAVLTWLPPMTGQHSSFYQVSSLTHYEITRNPDKVVFRLPSHIIRFVDDSAPVQGNYSYTISGINKSGAGTKVTSNTITLNPNEAVSMQNGSSSVCNASFFDSGGLVDNYKDNEDFTYTFFPGFDNSKIKVDFISFDIEFQRICSYDRLMVYDGPSIQSPLIGSLCGSVLPSRIISTNGPLTFRFISDNSIVGSGWSALVSCFGPFHDINVTVLGSNGPLEGALVTVDGNKVSTNERGVANFLGLQAGVRKFQVEKEGFLTTNVSILVDSNKSFSISLTPLNRIRFNIFHSQLPVEGASILINNYYLFSDISGSSEISLANGVHQFTIFKDGFGTVNGEVIVSNEDKEVEINFQKIFNVVFFIVGSEGPLNQAEIKIEGQTLKTNNQGEAVIVLIPGKYDYEVRYLNFPLLTGSFTVVDSNISLSLFLETDVNEVPDQNLIVFPNPFMERIMISGLSSTKSLRVYDTKGAMVFQAENNGSESLAIKTASWAPGLYLLKVISDINQVKTVKLIKN